MPLTVFGKFCISLLKTRQLAAGWISQYHNEQFRADCVVLTTHWYTCGLISHHPAKGFCEWDLQGRIILSLWLSTSSAKNRGAFIKARRIFPPFVFSKDKEEEVFIYIWRKIVATVSWMEIPLSPRLQVADLNSPPSTSNPCPPTPCSSNLPFPPFTPHTPPSTPIMETSCQLPLIPPCLAQQGGFYANF